MRDKRRPEEVLKEAYGVVLVKDEKMFNGEWRRQSRRKVGFIEVAKKLADERRLPGYDPKRWRRSGSASRRGKDFWGRCASMAPSSFASLPNATGLK